MIHGRAIRLSQAWPPALVAFASFALLPIGRPDRDLLRLAPSHYLWTLSPALALALLAIAALVLVLSLAPLPVVRRGYALVAAAAAAGLLTVGWLVTSATPFGAGAVIGLAALTVVAGTGLSEAGLIRDDRLVASALLFSGGFVLLFIIYPLATVLREAVIVKGTFTLGKAGETLAGPIFLLLDNPHTELRESRLIGALTLVGAAAGAVGRGIAARDAGAAGAGAVGGGVLALIVAMGVWASGAFPTSLYLALIVAPVATAVGLAFALLEQRAPAAWVRRLLSVVGILPVITPPFVFAFALIYMFGRRGFVTHGLLGTSSDWLKGVTGVAIAQALAFTPVAYLVLRGSVQALAPALEEAAQTLRARPWTVFRTVTWPLLRPGVAAAFLLTVIESLADFGNPLLLGGDRTFLATEVYVALTGRYDPNEAAVYGAVLLILVLAVFALQRRWLGTASFVTVSGKPGAGRLAPLPVALERLIETALLLWSLLVVVLYGSIVWGSLVALWGIDNTLTLQNYVDFSAAGLPVLLGTAKFALAAAVLATLVGLVIGYLVSRQRFPGRGLLEVGSMLSFATPGTVMGVAYVLSFNTGPWLLTGTAAIVVLALVFRNMPATVRGVIAGLAQIDRSLDEASTLLRASSATTLRRVLLPLLVPHLVAGMVFAFVRGMTAISQIIFLVSPGNMLATVLMLSWIEQGNLGRAAAMATVLIVSMLLLILALLAWSRRAGPVETAVALG